MSEYKDWTTRQLSQNVMKNLEVDDLAVNYELACGSITANELVVGGPDKKYNGLFYGTQNISSNITTADVIFNYNTIEDKLGCMSNGVYTCPYDGVVSVECCTGIRHTSNAGNAVVQVKVNGVWVTDVVYHSIEESGNAQSMFIGDSITISVNKGDTITISTRIASADAYIYAALVSNTAYTKIEYIRNFK